MESRSLSLYGVAFLAYVFGNDEPLVSAYSGWAK
jgi:hypothetical protein